MLPEQEVYVCLAQTVLRVAVVAATINHLVLGCW